MSFGSAYVGETFSCTLCANNDLPSGGGGGPADGGGSGGNKQIRDVRIEAEMKTPGLGKVQKLALGPIQSTDDNAAASKPVPSTTKKDDDDDQDENDGGGGAVAAEDLPPGATLQRIVSFDLKEEGNHVLAVTVSYYEATETSGRTRTFRKLYQFICKASLIVRTKVGVLQTTKSRADPDPAAAGTAPLRRWLLEAQLENCSDDTMQLDRVVMELEPGLSYRDCNWTGAPAAATLAGGGGARVEKPVLHPGEVEQVCFVVEATSRQKQLADGVAEEDVVDVLARATEASAGGGPDGRILFGVLGIGWRGEMGNKGFLSTGKLGTRAVR